MKVSDYVMNYIAGLGVKEVFCVTGGGAMHLNNSLGQSDRLKGVFMLHEQGAAIAAEASARVTDGYGCCLVTSGPGATNAITGLVGAYIDSIPVIFISGQAKRADLVGDQGIRQFGIQEVDIISLVKSYSKYAVQIREPEDIRYELEKASKIAVNGRPGPVWIDIPLDIQASLVEPDMLKSFDDSILPEYEISDDQVSEIISSINEAGRPVIMLGHGIRLSHSIEKMRLIYDKLGIPVLTSWNGVDLIEDNHPMYFGRPGGVGQRAANFILQSADLVITIGTRLNMLATGYNFEGFLKIAKHIMIDIDAAEMNKKSLHPNVKICCDVRSFADKFISRMSEIEAKNHDDWISKCRELTAKYPNRIPEQEPAEDCVSIYDVVEKISDYMTSSDIYQFTSSGTSVDIAMKVLRLKWGQRAFLTKGLAAMGYDIPACVGSCISSGLRRTICVTGDGSAAMNMQELEVIRRLKLPVKLFIADNKGYSMIYGSQKGNFGHLTGCTEENGLTLPDFNKLADAIGIKNFHIGINDNMEEIVAKCLSEDGPVICTFDADIVPKVFPKQSNYVDENGQMASRPIEDMVPRLSEDELREIILK